MGNGLVGDLLPDDEGSGRSASTPLKSYTETFYNYFPFYLSIGMTADEYWNQDCTLVKYYRKAHEYRQKRENERLYLQGLYFYEALIDVAPVLHAFAKPGTQPQPYLDSPFPLSIKEKNEREEARQKAQYEKIKAKVTAMVGKKSKGGTSDGRRND